MTDRYWVGEARAAFDQALVNAPREASFAEPGFWLQRAQVAATIAAAEQSRIANLIAWKQLQATRQASSDAGVGMLPLGTDETADEIEAALGIADPRPEPVDESRVRPVAGVQYPYLDGPHLILGPECFTGDGDEFPQDVIMWRGAAYRLEADQ